MNLERYSKVWDLEIKREVEQMSSAIAEEIARNIYVYFKHL